MHIIGSYGFQRRNVRPANAATICSYHHLSSIITSNLAGYLGIIGSHLLPALVHLRLT